jgi:uncharacterized membrane protein
MEELKNYGQWSLEDLLFEQKKLRKNEGLSAALIGIFFGVFAFSLFRKGFSFLVFIICGVFIYLIYNGSKSNKSNLNALKEEIAKRNT